MKCNIFKRLFFAILIIFDYDYLVFLSDINFKCVGTRIGLEFTPVLIIMTYCKIWHNFGRLCLGSVDLLAFPVTFPFSSFSP